MRKYILIPSSKILKKKGKMMKGLVKYNFGPANMEIREMPIPEIGPGQVRVEINTAGICGTDVHILSLIHI